MNQTGTVAFFVPHAGCPRSCSFCNQHVISGKLDVPTAAQVRDTLTTVQKRLGQRASSTQIAFFGGSFTAVCPALRHDLLEAAAAFCGEGAFAGIRISTRPDCIDAQILDELSQYPVKHIELGAQSMVDTVLDANRRGHTSADISRAAEQIHTYGFALTLQMMTGLYTDTDQGAVFTAKELAKLSPDSVRIYPTIVLQGTQLAVLWKEGRYHAATLQQAVQLCAELLHFFTEQGIPVIKLGLHQSDEIMVNMLAGPHHPAFRELCEGQVLAQKTAAMLADKGLAPQECSLLLAPQNLSALTGHGRQALAPLEGAKKIPIFTDNTLKYLDVSVQKR